MRPLIVGAGLGGLALGLALRRHGIQAHILEQAAALGEVGAGVQLSPNACKVLRALDVLPDVARHASAPAATTLREGRSGARIFSITQGPVAERRFGAPYLNIHRADLHGVLAQAFGETNIEVGQRAEPQQFISRASNPTSAPDDSGTPESADTPTAAHTPASHDTPAAAHALTSPNTPIIAADGIRSAWRAHVTGSSAPARYTGYVAWRALVPASAVGSAFPVDEACAWIAPGAHVVTYAVRGGAWFNLVAVTQSAEWTEESWTATGSHAELMQAFAHWHAPLKQLLAAIDRQPLYRWALHDRPVAQPWFRDRVALLGDACHPMLPFMGQGAAMALEDAWVLAGQLSQHRDGKQSLAHAYARYQALRAPRVARMVARVAANGQLYHAPDGLMRHLRLLPLRAADTLAPPALAKGIGWIYGYDATQEH
jgi:salicylate hydroxylase